MHERPCERRWQMDALSDAELFQRLHLATLEAGPLACPQIDETVLAAGTDDLMSSRAGPADETVRGLVWIRSVARP